MNRKYLFIIISLQKKYSSQDTILLIGAAIFHRRHMGRIHVGRGGGGKGGEGVKKREEFGLSARGAILPLPISHIKLRSLSHPHLASGLGVAKKMELLGF
jgi:hypothetical protein